LACRTPFPATLSRDDQRGGERQTAGAAFVITVDLDREVRIVDDETGRLVDARIDQRADW
jgi:uncharacterized Ntn-hydrolase superfamily protein